jgi:histone H3/H4
MSDDPPPPPRPPPISLPLSSGLGRLLGRITSFATLAPSGRAQSQLLVAHLVRRVLETAAHLARASSTPLCTLPYCANAVRAVFAGDLRRNVLVCGDRVIDLLECDPDRAADACVLGTDAVRDIVEQNTPRGLRLAPETAIYLAACAEYVLHEILTLAVVRASVGHDNVAARVTASHRLRAIDADAELAAACASVPLCDADTKPVLPRFPFGQLVRELHRARFPDDPPLKLSKPALLMLQNAVERRVARVLRRAKTLCAHAQRSKVNDADVRLARRLTADGRR